jgi:hypothetical protein
MCISRKVNEKATENDEEREGITGLSLKVARRDVKKLRGSWTQPVSRFFITLASPSRHFSIDLRNA